MRRAALMVLACGAAGAAGAEPAPAELIRRDVDEVLVVLRDPSLQSEGRHDARHARLRAIADRVFDWPEMARRSLGPRWRTLDGAEQRRFTELFTDRIAESYLDDMDRFGGDEAVTVLGSERLGDEQRVSTLLVTHSRERVTIDYFLRPTPSGWRIYDFAVEGVSLVNHYRALFARFLANHTFEELLLKLPRQRGGTSTRVAPMPVMATATRPRPGFACFPLGSPTGGAIE